jgi:hypothetical protein
MKLLMVFSLFFAFSQTSFADLDSSSSKALDQTQDLLRSKKQREAFIKKDKKAKEADQRVDKLTGGDASSKQELYDIAADVMKIVAEKAKKPNGDVDVDKMNKLMMQYQANPEAFYKQMTPEQKARIKKLGQKIGPSPASQK